MTLEELEKKAAEIRLSSLKAIYKTSHGYIGSAMSAVEILVALYYGDIGTGPVMNIDPNKPGWEDRDYFLLSKVKSVPVQYAILADLGFFDKQELEYFAQIGSFLKSYPEKKVPGICTTLREEGQGLSVACGLAMALKMDRKKNRIYTLVDRHELMVGNVWEAAQFAANHKLDNLVVVLDDAQFDDNLTFGEESQKFGAFGWDVVNVLDGHDFDKLLDAFLKSFRATMKPTLIRCKTISGKGIEFAERKAGYLKANLSEGEMINIIPKLKQQV